MSSRFSRLFTASRTAVKWILGIIFFPISIPIILVRFFLKKTPTLPKSIRTLGSVGIVIAWFALFAAIPDSQPTAPVTTNLAQNNPLQVATTSKTGAVQAIPIPEPYTSSAKSGSMVATSSPAINALAVATTTVATTTSISSTPTTQEDQTLYAVVHVVDGDTVDLSMNGKTERVRLIGIDTPEMVDLRKPVQCFGKEASAKLKSLLTGKRVSLEEDLSQDVRDKYGRLLGYLFLEDGTNVNLLMIQQGYANEYTYRTPYKYQSEFRAAATIARESKVGLWSDTTCAGDATKPAATDGNSSAITAPSVPTESSVEVVKKSTTGICHEPGSTYYAKTKNYTPYDTIDKCLQSGGRLPLR